LLTKIIKITGIVQGVGFRPWIFRLARQFDLKGTVNNDTEGVKILVQGDAENIQNFETSLQKSPPPVSRIDRIESQTVEDAFRYNDFRIESSMVSTEKSVPLSPDLNVCPECRRELFDPANRRYYYPFINCTNCGPRFSIIKDVPYDRALTTMHKFTLCSDCQTEYDDPADRRFHAQPNACHHCGPRLTLATPDKNAVITGNSAATNHTLFEKTADLLALGKIIAIKSIGGFHLVCDARNADAVGTLRRRKFREDKPFAVMMADILMIEKNCQVEPAEISLLESTPHPIVLLKNLPDRLLASAVAPGNHYYGVMLPYTPLHYLLFRHVRFPLVFTSGNVSDEPICSTNDEAFERLSGIADFFLVHDRAIHMRCDDSVTRVWRGGEYPLRRSRGYAPQPLNLPLPLRHTILACGAEQKNTFALAKNQRVYISHHIGDLKNLEVLTAFEQSITHYQQIFDIQPDAIAYDLHPEYLSTRYALTSPDWNAKPKIGIQHHHAHAVACMAENALSQPAIGIILDGTGYGRDGTIWGGEILLAEKHDFRRLGHFETVGMPGGQAAIDHPWQMGYSYLHAVFGTAVDDLQLPFLQAIRPVDRKVVQGLLSSGFNTPLTSSCGRLFDGVAAIAGLRSHVNYEGQAAIELEQVVDAAENGAYDFELKSKNDSFGIVWHSMIKQLVNDIQNQQPVSKIAARFHHGLANILAEAAQVASQTTGIRNVVLSGGVFMNLILLTELHRSLSARGLEVFTHQRVPPNDGGIALGQAVIAEAVLNAR